MSARLLEICVPSKGRPKVFVDRTMAILRHTSVPWSVYVEPQDKDDYLRAGVPREHLWVIDEDDAGLGYVLQEIRQDAMFRAVDTRYVWKMDDDVKHWFTGPKGHVLPKEEQGRMLDDVPRLVRKGECLLGGRFAGLTFGGKFMHTDWRDFTHVDKMAETTYVVRADVWNVPAEMRGWHEEFVVSASLLSQGYHTLRAGKYCWDADLSTLPGGLQSFDRVKAQAEYFDVLRDQFPDLAEWARRQEYGQKSGKTFVVTDKKFFNRTHSRPIPAGADLNRFFKPLRDTQP